MKINQKQIDALKQILYTDTTTGIHTNTLSALKRRGLVNSVNRLTVDAFPALNIEPVSVPPLHEEARRIQDEIIDICLNHGMSLYQRLSADMPEDIHVCDLMSAIYPDYLWELRGILARLKRRFKIAEGVS